VSEPFALFGTDLFGDAVCPKGRGPLAKRFEFPPFSVLDARSGEWQERKRAWLSLGIQGEIGRGMVRPHGKDTRPAAYGAGDDYAGGDCWRGVAEGNTGASVFDPVLCELAYRWFCPPGGLVLDPFAGGSVRGIVAAKRGHRYWGCDLRPEQIAANEAQAASMLTSGEPAPEFVCGDSRKALATAPLADFVFSCPPYGDLERYSDNERDLSAMAWTEFCAAYRSIVVGALERLRQNRFAAFVVGEFRDAKTGLYRGFVPFTCAVFVAAGAGFYNEAVLVTPCGSLPVRIGKQFTAGRKLGKSHQQLLVFVKGDATEAARACGQIVGAAA
jgi:hypothetical protein